MKRIVLLAIAMLMLFALFTGCNDKQPSDAPSDAPANTNNGQANTGDVPTKLVSIVYPEAISFDDSEAQYEVRQQNSVDDSIMNSLNEFSAHSASVILGSQKENVCYSPLSLYMALAMLSNGANGETQDEITAILNESDTAYLSQQMGKLFRLMYKKNDVSTFFMTNSLWMNGNFGVKKEFVDITTQNFYAAANTLDFNDPSAGDVISGWISDNTNNLLKPQIKVDPLDLLYIVNTVYLKDEWQDNFEENATTEDVFTLADGTDVKAEFMHRTFDTEVIKGDDFTGVSLYLKDTGKMTFILPDEGVDASSLLSTPEAVKDLLNADNFQHLSVKLSLPKFSFDSEFDLIQSLKDLGMQKAFKSEEADLTGITDFAAYVSAVKQGTDITVNENGLEAAAFTYIAVSLECAPMETEAIELNFNRPFVFIIENENVPVFIGAVQNPAS